MTKKYFSNLIAVFLLNLQAKKQVRLQNTAVTLPIVSHIVSQPSKCLEFMTFREGCFVMHVECKYLSEALETFFHHQFYKRRHKITSVN